jgi:DNA-binding transcriptional LysR family regulator
MELRHFRSFIAVAEECHYRRAAERLGISQPPLTIQIQALERELGATLLVRSKRGVKLTSAGELFLAECYATLSAADRAVAVARRAERGEEGRLEIGFTGSSSFNPFVARTIRQFGASFPHVEMALTEHNTLTLLNAVHSRTLDVVFLRPPVDTLDGVTLETILEEEMLLAVPVGHRLCGEKSLRLSKLKSEVFLLRPRTVGFGQSDGILEALQKAGVSQIVCRQSAPQVSSMLNLVAAGLGVTIVPASMRNVLPSDIIYLPIADASMPRAHLALAYRSAGSSPIVKSFVKQVRDQSPSKLKT